jgi:crotonobetainyl-CoA:carnitine CoA-transferase CaiB-like acyl-CoA transferase
MLEASISAMGWPVTHYLIGDVVPQPTGVQNATAAPSGTFHAADGPLNIAANQQHQYERLCHLVGRPDLLDDPRFIDREQRKLHREELNHELNRALRARPALEWENLLARAGVPAARILTVAEAVELEQLAFREFFADLEFPGATHVAPDQRRADHPTGGAARRLRVIGNGLLFDGERLHPTSPPPRLGEHNEGVDELLHRWRTPLAAVRPVPPLEHASQTEVTR